MPRNATIATLEQQYQLPTGALETLVNIESGGNPNAVSGKGARGLTQIMPATSADPGFGVTPMRNSSPYEQLRMGAEYLGAMYKRYGGDLGKAYAAYNAGPGAVDRYGGVPPYPETQNYVSKALNALVPSAQAAESQPQMRGVDLLSDTRGHDRPLPQDQLINPIGPRGRDLLSGEDMIGGGTTPLAGPKRFGNGENVPSYHLRDDLPAPAMVRADIALAPTMEDKVNTAKRYFKDVRVKGGELVYKVEDGVWARVNPPGIDRGDIAEFAAQSIPQVLGGTIGGAIGALGGPAAPLTVPIGVGLGAAAGEQLANLGRQFAGGTESRSVLQQLGDAMSTAGMNAMAGRAGELIQQGARAVGTAAKKALTGLPTGLKFDFRTLGLQEMPGTVSQKPTMRMFENALANMPGSADIIRQGYQANLEGMSRAAKQIGAQYGGEVLPKAAAGRQIRQYAAEALSRIEDKVSQRYEKAFDMVGNDMPTILPNLTKLSEQLQSELAGAKTSLKDVTGRALNEVNKIIQDNTDQGEIPFASLRRIRTLVGEMISNPVESGATGGWNPELKRIFGALSEDVKASARIANPEAAKALESTDRYYRAVKYHKGGVKGAVPLLEELQSKARDVDVFNAVMSQTADSGKRLNKMLRNMTPEEKGTISGSILGMLGRNKAGEFTPSTFMNNWQAMSDEAKRTLFEGSHYKSVVPELDRLVRVVKATTETQKLANPSGTARQLATMAALSGFLGGAGTAVYTGDIGAGAAAMGSAAMAGYVAPRYAAKLMTSPKFLRWMSTTLKNPPSAAGWGSTLARLTAIGEGQPDIKDAVSSFIDGLTGLNKPKGELWNPGQIQPVGGPQ